MPKLPAIPLDSRRAQLASAQALLTAEAKALMAARASLRRTRPRATPTATVRDAIDVVRPVLVQARAFSRQEGAKALDGELRPVRKQMAKAGAGPLSLAKTAPPVAQDIADVDAAVSRYQDSLLSAADRLEDPDLRALLSKADRTLDTEVTSLVAAGFNDERERILRQTAREYEGSEWLPAVLKLWDPTLDRRTCPACKAMEDNLVPIGRDFRRKLVPGKVHQRCRCLSVIVFAPIYLGRKKAA